MMKQNDFRRAGKVSVWIGNFETDLGLDDYINMSRKFEQYFGFELNERDMPETVVNNTQISIEELVDGFSWSESYSGHVVELAKRQDVAKATTMVVFLNLEYQPESAKPKEGAPLFFLGVVSFSVKRSN